MTCDPSHFRDTCVSLSHSHSMSLSQAAVSCAASQGVELVPLRVTGRHPAPGSSGDNSVCQDHTRWTIPGRKGLLAITQCPGADGGGGGGGFQRPPLPHGACVEDHGQGHLPGVAATPGPAVQDSPGRQGSESSSGPAGERPTLCSSGWGWHPVALASAWSRIRASWGVVSSAQGSSVRA